MAATQREIVEARRQFTAALKTLPDNFVACRDVKHAWMVENDFHVEEVAQVGRRQVYVGRDLVCGRCGMERNDLYVIRRDGLEKVNMSYARPKGYALPGVPRGVKASWIVQQEQYRRAMERVAGAKPGERETSET